MLWFVGLAVLAIIGVAMSFDFGERKEEQPPLESEDLAELMQNDLDMLSLGIRQVEDVIDEEKDGQSVSEGQLDLEAAALAMKAPEGAEDAQDPLPEDGEPEIANTRITKIPAQDHENSDLQDPESAGDDQRLPADIITLDRSQDDLVLIWDDRLGAEPQIRLAPNPTDPDVIDVMMDEEVVAHVPNATDLDENDIALIPESVANSLGWMRG